MGLKGRADDPHPLGPILGPGDVGDDRLGGGDIAARDPIDDSRDEEHRHGARETEKQIADFNAVARNYLPSQLK